MVLAALARRWTTSPSTPIYISDLFGSGKAHRLCISVIGLQVTNRRTAIVDSLSALHYVVISHHGFKPVEHLKHFIYLMLVLRCINRAIIVWRIQRGSQTLHVLSRPVLWRFSRNKIVTVGRKKTRAPCICVFMPERLGIMRSIYERHFTFSITFSLLPSALSSR